MTQHAHDPRPTSAVSGGVGFAGMAGLLAWTAAAWIYGMDGPLAGLTAVIACGIPMIAWSLLVDKVHRRPSTGIDWSAPRPLKDSIDISVLKLTGLWATWAAIAVLYCVARWYWTGNYGFSMKVLGNVAPWLFGLSIPYVIWIDRYLVNPRDGAYAFGQWICGSAAGEADRTAMAHHLRAWLVKGFFLAFMLSIVPGNFSEFMSWRGDGLAHPVDLANFLIAAMFLIDVAFATVGYVLTMRPLDAHIRTANPTMQGWVAALICYPPFALMVNGGPLDYHNDTAEWSFWLDGHLYAQWALGAVLVMLTGIYAWATVAFGPRFSNLTHRGILTHGPYAWSKHPAYLSKNLFWWLSSLPFLATSHSVVDMVRNTTILAAVSGVYYWRAKTEERHLSNDPNDPESYRAYAAWMARNGPIPRLIAAITGKRGRAELQPAE